MIRGLALACLVLAGCHLRDEPPPDLSAAACEVDFSGAAVGNFACELGLAQWRSSDDLGSFIVAALPIDSTTYDILVARPGMPVPGVLTDGDPDVICGIGLRPPFDNKAWGCAVDKLRHQGSFHLEVTSVLPLNHVDSDGGAVDGGGETIDQYTIHGTLDATLVPLMAGTSGNVTLHARF